MHVRREVPPDPTITQKESSELAPVKMGGEPGGPTRRTLRGPIAEVVDPLRTLDVKRRGWFFSTFRPAWQGAQPEVLS
jgi:hypothetical protein